MNKLTLSLGGEERTLLFGTMGFYKYIKEASGKDPLAWAQEFDERISKKDGSGSVLLLTDDIEAIVYAGLSVALDSQDKDIVPLDKVRKWCTAIDAAKAIEVIAAAFPPSTSDTPGEDLTQAAKS